eukprot:gene12774-biopygen16961
MRSRRRRKNCKTARRRRRKSANHPAAGPGNHEKRAAGAGNRGFGRQAIGKWGGKAYGVPSLRGTNLHLLLRNGFEHIICILDTDAG